MQARERRAIARMIREDFSFVVSVLLTLAVIVSALTALAGDEAAFMGMVDDLHMFAGWAMVVLTALHVLLLGGHMVCYAKRRFRNLFGVGGVIDAGPSWEERATAEQPFERR